MCVSLTPKLIKLREARPALCSLEMNYSGKYIYNLRKTLQLNKQLKHNMYPARKKELIPGTTSSGFKKLLFNRVEADFGELIPIYNRKKHRPSHTLIITNEKRRLSKLLLYQSKRKLDFWVGFLLSNIYKNKKTRNFYKTPIESFFDIIETETFVFLWKIQHCIYLTHSRQQLVHGNHKPTSFDLNWLIDKNMASIPKQSLVLNRKDWFKSYNKNWISIGEVLKY